MIKRPDAPKIVSLADRITKDHESRIVAIDGGYIYSTWANAGHSNESPLYRTKGCLTEWWYMGFWIKTRNTSHHAQHINFALSEVQGGRAGLVSYPDQYLIDVKIYTPENQKRVDVALAAADAAKHRGYRL